MIIRIAAVFVGVLFFVVGILMVLKEDFEYVTLLFFPFGALFIYYGISGKDPSSKKLEDHNS